MRNKKCMTYKEKRVAMCGRLRNASSLLQETWRSRTAYQDELEAIMHLADYEVDQSEVAKLVYQIAHSEDWLHDDIENTLDKLLRRPTSARAERSRRL
jgi:hypothetical protein